MDQQRMFSNASILAWLTYYAEHTQVDLGRTKILDITRKNKNLIPTVESHSSTLVFTEAGHHDIFYRMWTAGLGECQVWYNGDDQPWHQRLGRHADLKPQRPAHLQDRHAEHQLRPGLRAVCGKRDPGRPPLQDAHRPG